MGLIAPITGAIGGAISGFSNGGFTGALKGAAGGALNGFTGGAFNSGVGQAAQAGNLIQGVQDQRNQSANLADQRQQFDLVRQMIQNQMGQNQAGVGTAQQGLLNTTGQLQNNYGLNTSQDALMQMLKAGSGQQLGAAGTNLEQIANGGGLQSVDELLNAQGAQQSAATDQQASKLKASASGLGQLAGTASQFAQQRLRNQAMLDNNTLNAQTRLNANNQATTNRLQASGQLGSLLSQGQGQQLQAASLLGSQSLQNLAQQAGIYGQIGGLQQGVAGQNDALTALLAGQQLPLRQNGSPVVDAATQAPFLQLLLNKVGQMGQSPVQQSLPSVMTTPGFNPNVQLPTSLFQGVRF